MMKKDPAEQIARHESTRRTSGFLRVPDAFSGRVDTYFSRRSGLIVLAGPKGPLLAHYVGQAIPDPKRHKFHVNYQRDYPVFDGVKVPAEMRDDVTAVCVPIARVGEGRQTVAGRVPTLRGAGPAPGDRLILPVQSEDAGIVGHGIRVGPTQVEVSTPDASLLIGEGGIVVSGGIETREPTSKGVTAESPLFGVVPKTAVTFWAADFLPDVELIYQIVTYAVVIGQMVAAIANLVQIGGRLDN